MASELCKAGYEVAFTAGNHPQIDLMVVSPRGVQFVVDVKGQYLPGFWLVRRHKARANMFYIFAFVPPQKANRYFVLTQAQVNSEIPRQIERHRQSQIRKGNTGEKAGRMEGVTWKYALKFEDCWDRLPK